MFFDTFTWYVLSPLSPLETAKSPWRWLTIQWGHIRCVIGFHLTMYADRKLFSVYHCQRWTSIPTSSFSSPIIYNSRWSYLCISFVLIPDEAQFGVGGHGVVGSDVAVEQGTFHPNGFTGQNMVLLQIHWPVYASIHCEEKKEKLRIWW